MDAENIRRSTGWTKRYEKICEQTMLGYASLAIFAHVLSVHFGRARTTPMRPLRLVECRTTTQGMAIHTIVKGRMRGLFQSCGWYNKAFILTLGLLTLVWLERRAMMTSSPNRTSTTSMARLHLTLCRSENRCNAEGSGKTL